MNKTSVNKGQCGCGAVKIKLTLPNTLGDYAARACDCDYCIERNVAYVSDPTGSLEITSDENLKVDQHGSEQAKFLSCKHCNEMIAVTYEFDDLVKGAANANLLSEVDTMKFMRLFNQLTIFKLDYSISTINSFLPMSNNNPCHF